METRDIWGLAGTFLALLFGYLSLKYKASAGSVESLKDRLEARDMTILENDAQCEERIAKLRQFHQDDIAQQQQQIDDMKERSFQYRETIKVMSKEMQRKTLADIKTAKELVKVTEELQELKGDGHDTSN
jgi:ERCC4-type nuclease